MNFSNKDRKFIDEQNDLILSVGHKLKLIAKIEGVFRKDVDKNGLPERNPVEILEDPKSEIMHMYIQSKAVETS